MSIGTMLFNPFTGEPRDPRDIASDPKGILVWDGEEPLRAASRRAAPEAAEPVVSVSMVGVGTDKSRDTNPTRASPSIIRDAMASVPTEVFTNAGFATHGYPAAPTDSQAGRDAVEARPRNFSTLLPGMELVPCAIWKDGPGGKPWLYVPHADGNWVSAAQLEPFSIGIIDYWRRDHAAWIDRLSTPTGRAAE